MKRGLTISFIILFLLAACMALPSPAPARTPPAVTSAPATPTPSPSPSPAQAAGATFVPMKFSVAGLDELSALLPGKAGFEWRYFGFAEYAMTMTLKSITQTNGVLSYEAQGAVADMSGGEASGDFSVKVVYSVMPGVIGQSLMSTKAMDCALPNIELIRTPLTKGAQWVQSIKDRYGKQVNVDCTITDVKSSNGRKTYFVYYKVEGSDYYEKREITEGAGVTAYDKLYMYDSGREEIGYRLYTPDVKAEMAGWDEWLPPLNTDLTYFGLAEYGHKGRLIKLSATGSQVIYEFRGTYDDATGNFSKFAVDYYVDMTRGTVTEQAVSNERGKKEVNSKLHNLVLLKFPLAKGNRWSHQAKLNGKDVTVEAEITDYDESKGVVKVRYTAKGAAGYYDGTYIETRTFEKGYGMTGFGNLLPGSIGISVSDAKDAVKLNEAVAQHMFGYSLNKTLLQ